MKKRGDGTTHPPPVRAEQAATDEHSTGIGVQTPDGRTEHTQFTIDSFTHAAGYGFLSNYHPSSIWIKGKQYPTVEHAYQAHKTLDEYSHELIRKSSSPNEAKRLGQSIQVRSDWDSVKIDLMKEFIRLKFENPFLAHKLTSTCDADLVYGNTWNDRFWGVCRGSGQNWLGRILMLERERIKKELEVDYPDPNTTSDLYLIKK